MFDSAPEPRRQARSICSDLARAHGWTAAEAKDIEALRVWLEELPPVAALKPRCEQVIRKLK